MPRIIEIEIDAKGYVHPVDPAVSVPTGRAVLIWHTPSEDPALLLPEPALADWLNAQEDEAWAHLQPSK